MQGRFVDTVIGRVWFTGKSSDELALGTRKNELRAKVIPHVSRTLKNGIYAGREELHKPRKDGFVVFHSFEGVADIDGLKVQHRVKVGKRKRPKTARFSMTLSRARWIWGRTVSMMTGWPSLNATAGAALKDLGSVIKRAAGRGSSPAPVADFVRQPIERPRENATCPVHEKGNDHPRHESAKQPAHPIPVAIEQPMKPLPVIAPSGKHQHPARDGGECAKRRGHVFDKARRYLPCHFILFLGLLKLAH